jgi:uncharacterized protein YbjT (DUF2867 family)
MILVTGANGTNGKELMKQLSAAGNTVRVFFAPIGDARVSLVDVRDIAAVAAKVLTESGRSGKFYDITGPEALTHAELASQLSDALERIPKHLAIARSFRFAGGI